MPTIGAIYIYTNIYLVWHSKFAEGHSGYVKDTKGKKAVVV